MVMATKQQHTKLAVRAATAFVLGIAFASAVQAESADRAQSVRVQVDNDLFAGSEQDRDYTGGLAVTFSGLGARENAFSLAPALDAIDAAVGHGAGSSQRYDAQQIGMIAFTPTNISESAPIHDDRPYASLLFVSNGKIAVSHDGRTAWFSSFTVGALGLGITKDIHNAIHDIVGSPIARGYEHQISAGGEPTAKYTVARQSLWIANPSGTLDVKTTVQGSVGYLTEASAAVSLRFGRFDTPWWSLAPELSDYMAAPVPTERRYAVAETYLHAGVRVKARGYNVFLQGQFRESNVRYSYDEMEPIVAEAWLGVVTELTTDAQLSYSVNYQTAELRYGDAARDAIWGAVQLTFNF